MNDQKFIKESINFMITNSSVIDIVGGEIPIFLRESPTNVESVVNGELQLTQIPANQPAFTKDKNCFVVEPASYNFLKWTLDLSRNEWQKGSAITIQTNKSPGADRSFSADKVTWAAGNGNTQILRQEIELSAGTNFYCSGIFKIDGGEFDTTDVMRITGGVAESVSISLSKLTESGLLGFSFKTAGTRSKSSFRSSDYLPIILVGTDAIVINLSGVADNELVGKRLFFKKINLVVDIVSNGESSPDGSTVIVTNVSTLISQGVSATTGVRIVDPAKQVCFFELYSENPATITWCGAQIEEKSFRTSMILQKEAIEYRAATNFYFMRSPIQGLKSCGVFFKLSYWDGDGNIADFGNLKIAIQSGKLRVSTASTSIVSRWELPKQCSVYIQISAKGSSISLYVDKILEAKTVQAEFVGAKSRLTFNSEGVRHFETFLTLNQALDERDSTEIGYYNVGGIDLLFSDPTIVDSTNLISYTNIIKLPKATIPSFSPPSREMVTAIDQASEVVSVSDPDIFNEDQILFVYRASTLIKQSSIIGKTNNGLTLDSVLSIEVGDILTQSNGKAGKTRLRFPFIAIDSQVILSVNHSQKTIAVNTALSFNRGVAVIQTDQQGDVTELIIIDIYYNSSGSDILLVDSTQGIEEGHLIIQSEDSLLISPTNYLVSFSKPVQNVKVALATQNGIVLENYNKEEIQLIDTSIKVFL